MRHFRVSNGKRSDFVILDDTAAEKAVVDSEADPILCQSVEVGVVIFVNDDKYPETRKY